MATAMLPQPASGRRPTQPRNLIRPMGGLALLGVLLILAAPPVAAFQDQHTDLCGVSTVVCVVCSGTDAAIRYGIEKTPGGYMAWVPTVVMGSYGYGWC